MSFTMEDRWNEMEWKFSARVEWDEMDKAIHTQEDLLKGRDSWQVTHLKNSLPGAMEFAKGQLHAVAPLADPVTKSQDLSIAKTDPVVNFS